MGFVFTISTPVVSQAILPLPCYLALPSPLGGIDRSWNRISQNLFPGGPKDPAVVLAGAPLVTQVPGGGAWVRARPSCPVLVDPRGSWK